MILLPMEPGYPSTPPDTLVGNQAVVHHNSAYISPEVCQNQYVFMKCLSFDA